MMLMDVSRGILPTLLPHQPLQSVTRHLPPPQRWKKRSASGEQEGPWGTEMLQAGSLWSCPLERKMETLVAQVGHISHREPGGWARGGALQSGIFAGVGLCAGDKPW